MILTEHIPHLRRLEPYMHGPMLMLGRQTNTSAYRFPCDYKTMDLDGGDFLFDLGDEKAHQKTNIVGYHIEAYNTVFNLGTLEHVWDAHTAHVDTFWFTTQAGTVCEPPKRNCGKSILLWFAAKRVEAVFADHWRKPSQVYVDGKKPA